MTTPENDAPLWMDDVPPPSDEDMPAFPQEGEDHYEVPGGYEAPPVTTSAPPVSAEITPEAVDACLREQFRLPSFREGQREVIETVLAGRSALAVMPTGAGKSLCFQLPALLLPGISLVISPLIALMKDQVDSLIAKNLSATYINSTLSWSEQRQRLDQMVRGEVKLIFVAPERFRSEAFKTALRHAHVSLFVIDEAHCVSEWGHDFRPDYLALGKARRDMGEPVTLALTATATPNVRTDIVRMLEMPGADIFVSGFERPNLFLEVYRARGKQDKLARMEALIRHMGGTSIVYCATRKAVDEVAAQLRMARFKVGAYHGGMTDTSRDKVQDDFMGGDFDVLVATNAFGMGVDKSDIRAIVHYQIPSSLEAYYQEAGRAGRDGGPSHCLLLYNYADRHVPDFFIKNAHPDRHIIEGTWNVVRQGHQRYDPYRIARSVRGKKKVSQMAVGSALRLLRRFGHINYQAQSDEPIEVLDTGTLKVDWRSLAERRSYDEEKLQKVIYFAAGKRCRTEDILRYFGSPTSFGDRCGHCDNCIDVAPYATTAEASKRPRLVPGHTARTHDASAGSTSARTSQKRSPNDFKPISSPEPTITVIRKVLACIARGRQRISVSMISRILTGSKSANVIRYNHDKNSTYGLLRDLTIKQITVLLDDMLAAGFLTQDGFSVLLTDEAVDVMKGKAELPEALAEALDARFEHQSNPAVRQAMARVLGMGPPNGNASTPAPFNGQHKVSNTVARTLGMLIEGYSLKEVSRERDIKTMTLVKHVITAARAGAIDDLDFEPYLDKTMIPAIHTVCARQSWEEGMRDFREAVSHEMGGRQVSYDLLRMNIAYLIKQGELQ